MKILIVEDEKRLATTIKRGLKLRGYAVDLIHDGGEAKQRILMYRNEYDLIILDLMLPTLSGEEICIEVRKAGVLTPILVLTAHNDEKIKVDLLHEGADDYMEKPFSFSELEARIVALLRRPHDTLPVELRSPEGSIMLDRKTHTVTVYDAHVPLTLKEFMLLEYFLRNPYKVITRDELLEHAWDFSFSAFSNIVDVHVKNLRKKLDATRTKARIETIRGVGYRFTG